MNTKPAIIYRDYSPRTAEKLMRQLHASGRQRATPLPVFFRADDIAVSSKNFTRLLRLFEQYAVPLCLAVVPGWLTAARMSALNHVCDPQSPLWCFHQHGWLHRNHEQQGKKCEFGRSRSEQLIRNDLFNGQQRLRRIMGDQVCRPFFTPPWNRCSDETIRQLQRLGFHGISRNLVTPHEAGQLLPEFSVNIDLHTRRGQNAVADFAALGQEFDRAVKTGTVGFMIHHQRMNDQAFDLLQRILQVCVSCRLIKPVHFAALRTQTTFE